MYLGPGFCPNPAAMPNTSPPPPPAEQAGLALLAAFAHRVAERQNPTPVPPANDPASLRGRLAEAVVALLRQKVPYPRQHRLGALLYCFLENHYWKIGPLAQHTTGSESVTLRALNQLMHVKLVERLGKGPAGRYHLTPAGELFLLETLPLPAVPPEAE